MTRFLLLIAILGGGFAFLYTHPELLPDNPAKPEDVPKSCDHDVAAQFKNLFGTSDRSGANRIVDIADFHFVSFDANKPELHCSARLTFASGGERSCDLRVHLSDFDKQVLYGFNCTPF